jgi:tRNA threonylcarbamoyladenosine biosynthesis protein TsaE
MSNKKVIISSADEMFDLGVKLSKQLAASDVVVLTGDLGAGKTIFAKGIGHGLGHQVVTSPTFVISRIYKGKPNFIHIDAYRLLGYGQNSFIDLDFESYLTSSVFVIEWGKEFIDSLTDQYLEIRISPGQDESSRVVEYLPIGDRWNELAL